MTIKKLINPKGETYKNLKNFALGNTIGWSYCPAASGHPRNYFNSYPGELEYHFERSGIPLDSLDNYGNIPVYGHTVIDRPSYYAKGCAFEYLDPNNYNLVPEITSDSYELVKRFLYGVLVANRKNENLYIRSILRCNFNATHPDPNGQIAGYPHEDHNSVDMPHKNMLVYFTNAGGKTFVGTDSHSPEEDDIIIFDSSKLHYQETPKSERRVVMVMTYI